MKNASEVVKAETKISTSYTSRKGLTYEELETDAKDWHSSEIYEYIGNEVIYCVPEEYDEARTRFSAKGRCHLCGHPIRYEHYIQNDKTKMYMIVGSECVLNPDGKTIKKIVKEFKENKIRKEAKKFLSDYIEWAKTQKEFEFPKDNWQANLIKRPVWEEMRKAEKMLEDFEKTGARKLKNFMNKNKGFEKNPPIKQKDREDLNIVKNLKNLLFCIDNQIERKIGFGKYKDKWISEVDEGYVKWAREVQQNE